MTKDFSKKIIKEIKKSNIKPVSKNVFIVKNIFFWFLYFFSLVLSILSITIILSYLFDIDLVLYKKVWLINLVFTFLPFFWILFVIFSSIFSFISIKNTKRWYKISFIKIVVLNFLLSILFWIFLNLAWFNKTIEDNLQKVIPKYREFLVWDKSSRMIEVWQNEEKWLLIGEILDISWNHIKFIDYNDKNWSLMISDNTLIRDKVVLRKWELIKLIWNKTWDNIFQVNEIRPFKK